MSSTDDAQYDIDWSTAHTDPQVRYRYYRCLDCGHELCVSPRAGTRVLPSMYCMECDGGIPFSLYKVEIHDGTQLYRDEETNTDRSVSSYLDGRGES